MDFKKRVPGITGILTIFPVLLILFQVSVWPSALYENHGILTLQKTIDLAMRNNTDLKISENIVKQSEIGVSQNRRNFFPSCSISGNLALNHGKSIEGNSGTYIDQDSTSFNFNLSAELNLFNGFFDIASLKQSKFSLKASGDELIRTRQFVVFETVQRYFKVVLAKELIKVDTDNLNAQKLQLSRIEDLFKSGSRPRADLYQQKAEISGYEYELLNSERNLKLKKLELLKVLGLEPHTNYSVADPGIDIMIKSIRGLDINPLNADTFSKRPDLRSYANRVKASGQEIKASKSGYYPKLFLFSSLSGNYTNLNEMYDFTQQLDNTLNHSVGLSLSIPVSDKGRTKSNVAISRINHNNDKLSLKNLKHQINIEIKQAAEDFITAEKQITVSGSQSEYSKEAMESVEERYRVNAATMMELLQARSQYHESLYNLAEAKTNLIVRGVALFYYSGDMDGMLRLININNKEK